MGQAIRSCVICEQRVQLSEPDQARLAKKAKKSPSPFVDAAAVDDSVSLLTDFLAITKSG